MTVVKMGAIKPVMPGVKTNAGRHVKANVIIPVKMDVQIPVEDVKVVAGITVPHVTILVRMVV